MSEDTTLAVIDPLSLAQDLIRCPSVTPDDAGALGVLEAALTPLGFSCRRLPFAAEGTPPIDNLYARLGTDRPHFCFAGHTDVVPVGARTAWRHDPFAAEIADGVLFGRGAADMKSAIAAFVAAVARRRAQSGDATGSISLLITGDEEGPAINGTVKMLGWLAQHGELPDHCLVGEPSSAARAGDTIKIGRRGSMNVVLRVRGVQGHVAYPGRALNPIPVAAELVGRLAELVLDTGTAHFEPSTLAFTSLDVGNQATNVIPGEVRVAFNIRFNDAHTPDSLRRRVAAIADSVASERGGEIAIAQDVTATAFLTQPGPYTDLLRDAVADVTGASPEFSTGGGTSDARFIKDFCPVAELGLSGTTMHQTDECVAVAEIETLTQIYQAVLGRYFAGPRP